tara:strand:+ start:433 stop:858 length:426 start_codon:yes stop_codon:yes gene_type:complete
LDKKIKRILGIDYGNKRVGISISDELQLTAQPLTLLKRENDKDLITEIKKIISLYEIEMIVIGFPVLLDGTHSKQTKITKKFISLMRKSSELPIEKWEERLSTIEAGKILSSASKNKRKQNIDIVSAQIILQGFLDKIRKD